MRWKVDDEEIVAESFFTDRPGKGISISDLKDYYFDHPSRIFYISLFGDDTRYGKNQHATLSLFLRRSNNDHGMELLFPYQRDTRVILESDFSIIVEGVLIIFMNVDMILPAIIHLSTTLKA